MSLILPAFLWKVVLPVRTLFRVLIAGDLIDSLVRERLCSVYLPEATHPMFPEPLVSRHLSLLPDQSNHTLAFRATLGPDGDMLDCSVFPSLINRVRCVTYREADSLLSQLPSSSVQSSDDKVTMRRDLDWLARISTCSHVIVVARADLIPRPSSF